VSEEVLPKLAHKSISAFVLAGVPMYYFTQRGLKLPSWLCKLTNHGVLPVIMLTESLYSAFLSSWTARLRGHPARPAGFGWEAVATEGDEMEMAEGRR
jgi:hypothetical protein